jgi:hypothetical protein
MSARIPPGFGEINMQFNLTGDPQPMITSLGLDLTTGVVPDQTEANTMLTAMQTAFDEVLTATYSIGPGWVIYGQDGPDDIRVDGTIAPVSGDQAVSPLVSNTAVLVRKVTGLGGRRNRGRMYIPGTPETWVDSLGQLELVNLTTWQTQMTNLRADLIGLPTIDNLVVLHESAPFTPTVITGLTVQRLVATQRRRLRP